MLNIVVFRLNVVCSLRTATQACLISGRRFATKCFLLDISWDGLRDRDAISQAIEALMKARLLRLEGRELVDFPRLILVKLFPRAVEDRNVVKGLKKNGGEKGRRVKKREKENEGEKGVADFYARKRKWNFVRSGCLRSTSFRDEQ